MDENLTKQEQIHSKGFNIFRGDPEHLYDLYGRIKVGPKDLEDAVLTFGAPGKRQEARVVRIITHGFSDVVGTYEDSGTFGFVVADSQRC